MGVVQGAEYSVVQVRGHVGTRRLLAGLMPEHACTLQVFSAPNYCDQMGNKGAFIHLDETLKPKFTTFTAVPHPAVRPMQYAGMFGSFFGS